jgi:uncharacterized membrane protein YgcG
MIAYNETWLANIRVQNILKKELSRGSITEDEFSAILAKYPVLFYSPAFFVRVGLFILTCVIVLFADGLLSLVFMSTGLIEASGWPIFLGLLSYASLEFIIATKNHFRSGVDDALLFLAALQLTVGVAILLYGGAENYLALSIIVFPLCLFFTIRFSDMLMAAFCCCAFFSTVFFGLEKIGSLGLNVMPFVLMAVSAGAYWLLLKYKNQARLVNYANCLVVAQTVCLLTLYAAGNYYIVQTLSDQLNGTSKPIAFGMIFWAWTMILPLVYLAFGIKNKDAIRLRTCLFLIAAAVLTFRTYYHLLPVDVMLILGGAAILAIAYAITKYLKMPRYGFTLEDGDDVDLMDNLRVESLIVAQTFSQPTTAHPQEGVKFGGGDFGGGGSSANF